MFLLTIQPDRLAYIGDITITGVRRSISFYREIIYGLRDKPYIAVERMNRNGQDLCYLNIVLCDKSCIYILEI